MFLIYFLFLGVLDGAVGSSCYNVEDPCTLSTYQEIPYMITRDKTVGYFGELTNRTFCDQYQIDLNVWYRSDFNITTECVDIGHCGTINPVWMNGTIPSPGDGVVSRTTCKSTASTCCERTYSLTMKNCGSYTTYCFVDVPKACYQRYCFDVGESASNTTAGSETNTEQTPTTVCPDKAVDLPNVTGRSIELSTIDNGGVSVNDESLDDGWFTTVHAGIQYLMADKTNIPHVDSCGAYYPIYLQDRHPDPIAMVDGSEVSVTACLKSYVDDCDITYDVKIRKCGQKVQYYLVTTVRYAGYCFDVGYNISTPTTAPTVTTSGSATSTENVHRSTLTSELESKSTVTVETTSRSTIATTGQGQVTSHGTKITEDPNPVLIVLIVVVVLLITALTGLIIYIVVKRTLWQKSWDQGSLPEKKDGQNHYDDLQVVDNAPHVYDYLK